MLAFFSFVSHFLHNNIFRGQIFFSSNFVILDRLFQGDNLLLFNSEQENVWESLFILKL